MKDKIIKIITTIALLVFCFFNIYYNFEYTTIKSIIINICLLTGGVFIFNSVIQKMITTNYQLTTKSIMKKYIMLYTLMYFISLVFHSSFHNIIFLIINYFAILISSLLSYLYCRREYKAAYRKSLGVLAINLVVLLLFDLSKSLFIALPSMILISSIANYVDASSLFRKKNIMYYGIITIVIILTSFIDKFVLIALIPLFEKVHRGNKNQIEIYAYFILLVLFLMLITPNLFMPFTVSDKNLVLSIVALFTVGYVMTASSKLDNRISIMIFIYITSACLFKFNVMNIIYLFPLMCTIIYIKLDKFRFKIYSFSKRVPNEIKYVSAVIPNYNYANYLDERIDSILNQTYPISELVILDDCSKDNSVEVLENKIKEIKNNYPSLKVEFIQNKKNSGNVFKQWLKCFEVCHGDYLWICEADDSCNKNFLNNVMLGFNNDDVVISYCESKTIDEFGKIKKKDLREWVDIFETDNWYQSYTHTGNYELANFLCINNTIANVSGAVLKIDKKINYKKYLTEAQNFILAGDWYFYSKVLLHGSIAYCEKSLNYHRMHSKSVTLTTDNFVHFNEIKTIQNSIKKSVKITDQAKERIKQRDTELKRNLCISKDELYYDKINIKDIINKNKIKDATLLSIIIPVYNVEKYLDKCLNSVFKNLPIKTEVIIINDGSPDNSEEIILKHQKIHKEIRYIKKENGGLSSVKNRGLKEAKGRYVIFLDSDDYVSSNMYSTMLKKALDNNADMVCCDILTTYEDGNVNYSTMNNYSRTSKTMKFLDVPLMATSANKMVKKELYNNLKFPEGKNNEDVAVSPILIARCKNIAYIPSPFYKYVQREGSIQNSGFNEKRFVIFDTVEICFDRAKEFDCSIREEIVGAVVTHQIVAMLLYLIGNVKNKEERLNLINIFCQKFDTLKCYDNKYIEEYLKTMNKTKLLDYIKNNNMKAINYIITR